MNAQNANPEAVVNAYIEGTATRNTDLLKSIFAENALMVGWLGPDLLHGGPEPFYDALEANEVGDDYSAEIIRIDITHPIAVAEISERNLLGMSFTNHFHLIHTDADGWKISSKLFRHY
ncbi:nuclear transport factor 2 family protein [uncultured Tateyamaria sp.]|uniref:nuclear transport factor 2 family protein n=1 Tax=uncultured Tateyamaria sp. TaxID=455651 RepID=UPI00263575B3|nr:nuclear transport factor 2 family protein [uncultured Tateyamaria sp.]